MTAIAEQERQRRRKAVNFARGSVRLEGFVVSPDVERIAEQFVDGELTLPDYIAAVLAISKLDTDTPME